MSEVKTLESMDSVLDQILTLLLNLPDDVNSETASKRLYALFESISKTAKEGSIEKYLSASLWIDLLNEQSQQLIVRLIKLAEQRDILMTLAKLPAVIGLGTAQSSSSNTSS
jgi:hypothetical protein